MKLYEVKGPCLIRIVGIPRIPPAHQPLRKGEELMFYHVDGMFSYCLNSKQQIVHLGRSVEVEVIDADCE